MIDGLASIFIGAGDDRIEAEARPDLAGIVPWPVFASNATPPRYWRLDWSADWPRPIEVTEQVHTMLSTRVEAQRQRVFADTRMRAKRNVADPEEERSDIVRAPKIRRERGEVKIETRVEIDKASGKVTGRRSGDRVQSWASRYYRRGEITRRQFRAGERLAKAAEGAQVSIPSILDPDKLNGPRGGGGRDLVMIELGSMAAESAARLRSAVAALGPTQPVVLWVVVEGRSASEWAKETGRPLRDGMAALRLGLDALADHYGLDSSGSTIHSSRQHE